MYVCVLYVQVHVNVYAQVQGGPVNGRRLPQYYYYYYYYVCVCTMYVYVGRKAEVRQFSGVGSLFYHVGVLDQLRTSGVAADTLPPEPSLLPYALKTRS